MAKITNKAKGGRGVIASGSRRPTMIAPGATVEIEPKDNAHFRALVKSGDLVVENSALEGHQDGSGDNPPSEPEITPPAQAEPAVEPVSDDEERRATIRGAIAGLSDDDFTGSGKPSVDAINARMPDGFSDVSSKERDAVWAEMKD